jgi:hypothetical protein
LRSLLESLDLGLNGGGPLRVLLLGLVQRSLRLVDRLLTAFTLLLPGGLFLRPFKLAAPPFPFVVESGLSFRNLVDGARGRLFRLWAFRLAGGFRWSSAAKISGQFSMFVNLPLSVWSCKQLAGQSERFGSCQFIPHCVEFIASRQARPN